MGVRPRTVILATLVLGIGLGVAAFAAEHTADICHFPPGNPENVQVLSVGDKAAARHLDRHGDWPVVAFNVNGVGCAFCSEPSDDCEIFCVGPPLCFCPPGTEEECCEANPCCDPCPEPKPEECNVISCASDPPECSVTVCSG